MAKVAAHPVLVLFATRTIPASQGCVKRDRHATRWQRAGQGIGAGITVLLWPDGHTMCDCVSKPLSPDDYAALVL